MMRSMLPRFICQVTKYGAARMTAPGEKRGRGRPPKHGEAMSGAERQELYAKARGRDMAEVAYALKERLDSKAARTAFANLYRGTLSGQRLRRGLTRLLNDDPAALAFFDSLILSYDEK
jgi:hypothetical protein